MDEERGAPQHWVNQQVDQRLSDLKQSLDTAWKELREEIRRNDTRGNTINVLDERMKDLRGRVDGVEKAIRDDVMSHEDFKPYRNGIIAVITAVGMAVLGALLKIVIAPR